MYSVRTVSRLWIEFSSSTHNSLDLFGIVGSGFHNIFVTYEKFETNLVDLNQNRTYSCWKPEKPHSTAWTNQDTMSQWDRRTSKHGSTSQAYVLKAPWSFPSYTTYQKIIAHACGRLRRPRFDHRWPIQSVNSRDDILVQQSDSSFRFLTVCQAYDI